MYEKWIAAKTKTMKTYQIALLVFLGIGVMIMLFNFLLIKSIDYKIVDGKVFYRTLNNVNYKWDLREVKGADADSFKKLGWSYGMDKSHVYLKDNRLEYADPNTLKIIDGTISWAQDAKAVYRYGNKVSSEPHNFKQLSRNYFKDSRKVFYNTNILEFADPQSFEVLGENGFYAKDKAKVYCSGKLIEDAEASSFQHVDGLFAVDANRVYYAGKPLELETLEGLEILDENYGKTTQQVFFKDKLVEGADANSFYMTKNKSDFPIGVDKYSEYEFGRRKHS